MTEFTNLELNKDVDSMTEDEAKQTLSDFMDSHEDNRDAYDAKASEVTAVEEEYSEEIETLEEKVSEFKSERAEAAAEFVRMPAELLAERFSFSELEQIIEEGRDSEEFSEEEDTDEDDERLTDFVDRDQKGKVNGDGTESKMNDKFRRTEEELLMEQGLISGGD